MSTSRINRLASRLVARGRVSVVYDPQTKQKYRYLERHKILNKYEGRDDVFVSFTSIPKLGINPKTGYRTPIGVYSYPVSYVKEETSSPYGEETGIIDFRVPFPPVERQTYLHIFKAQNLGRALHFSEGDINVLLRYKNYEGYTLSVDDLELIEDVIKDVRRFFDETQDEIEEVIHGPSKTRDKYSTWFDKYSKIIEPIDTIDPDLSWIFSEGAGINYHDMGNFASPRYRESVYYYIKSKVFDFLHEKQKLRDSVFPYEAELMRLVISSLGNEREYYRIKKTTLSQRVACDQAFVWNMTRNLAKENPVKWTGLMRQLGIIGAVDDGTGTIHPSEPTQAVFFDPGSIKVLEVIHNEKPKQLKESDESESSGDVSSGFSYWAINAEQNLEYAASQITRIINNLSNSLKIPGSAYPGMIKHYMKNIMKILGWIHTNARNAKNWYPLRKNLIQEIETLATLVKRADMDIPPEMDRVVQMLSR